MDHCVLLVTIPRSGKFVSKTCRVQVDTGQGQWPFRQNSRPLRSRCRPRFRIVRPPEGSAAQGLRPAVGRQSIEEFDVVRARQRRPGLALQFQFRRPVPKSMRFRGTSGPDQTLGRFVRCLPRSIDRARLRHPPYVPQMNCEHRHETRNNRAVLFASEVTVAPACDSALAWWNGRE